ncbi:hypothetical protein ACFLU1_03330 [Chloroflexota bacterium]
MDVSSGGGSIKVDEVALPSYPYALDLDVGIAVTVEAVPDLGYVFDGWNGDLSGTTNPTTLAIDCTKSITATFSIDWTLVMIVIVSLVIVGLLVSAVIVRRGAG